MNIIGGIKMKKLIEYQMKKILIGKLEKY